MRLPIGAMPAASLFEIDAPAGMLPAIGAAIVGFAGPDATIEVVGTVPVDNVIYTPGTAGQLGTLDLMDGATRVGTLTLAGDGADFTFAVQQLSPTVSAITATPQTYDWIGPQAGDWATASNWNNVTNGTNPATVAPGSGDFAVVGPSVTLTGTGSSAGLTFQPATYGSGHYVVAGDFNTGDLVADGATLTVTAGATLSAAQANLDYTGSQPVSSAPQVFGGDAVLVNGPSASLRVSGALWFDSESVSGTGDTTLLSVTNGGAIQAGTLLATGDIAVDSLSSLTVGNATTATAGALTVGTGANVVMYALPFAASTTIAANVRVLAGGQIYGQTVTLAGSPASPQSGTVVDNGTIIGDTLQFNGLAGTLSGNGTVETETYLNQGIIELNERVGPGSLDFANFATLIDASAIAPGNTIDMTYRPNTIFPQPDLTTFEIDVPAASTAAPAGLLPTIGATIVGFGGTAAVLAIAGTVSVDHATWRAGSSGSPGVLTLMNGPTAVGTLHLAGNFAGDSFVTQQISPTLTDITALPASTFDWIGPLSGDWSTASNWADITTGQTPATSAPGIADVVLFNSPTAQAQVITGIGTVASATFGGDNIVTGALNIGSIVIAGTLAISAGGSVNTYQMTIDQGGSVDVNGAGSGLMVDAALTMNGATSLAATDGAVIQTDGLTQFAVSELLIPGQLIIFLPLSSSIAVDATSSIEVGHADDAAAGALTIDSGLTASLPGTLAANLVIMAGATASDQAGLLSGNGTIDSGGALSGAVTLTTGTWIDNGVIAGETLAIGSSGTTGSLSLSGSGSIAVSDGGLLQVVQDIGPAALTLQLGNDATLAADAAIGAGNTISLAGVGDLLQLGSLPAVDAVITGFTTGDMLLVDGSAVSATSYTAGSAGNPGTLSLLNGAMPVAALTLAGDYSGDSFIVTQFGGDQTGITVSPPNPGTPSGGTSGNDEFVWVGPAAGAWGTAANWQDVTAGTNPAAVAPGSNDTVTINSQLGTIQVVSGVGNAATLLTADVADLGTLTVGRLIAGGGLVTLQATGQSELGSALLVEAGGTIAAGSVAVGVDGVIDVNGAGASLLVGGTLSYAGSSLGTGGGLGATNGGVIDLGGLISQPNNSLPPGEILVDSPPFDGVKLSVDSLSSIEIGDADDATTGAITFDPGVNAELNNGTLVGTTILRSGATVTAASGYYVNVVGNLLVNQGAVLSGPNSLTGGSIVDNGTIDDAGIVTLGTGAAMSGTGIVDVQSGASFNNYGTIATGGLTIDLASKAGFGIHAGIGAGNTIMLAGGDISVSLSTRQPDNAFSGPLPVVNGVIVGFAPTDVLDFEAATITGETDTPGAGGGVGTLTVLDGTTTVSTLQLAGDYTGDTFVVDPYLADYTNVPDKLTPGAMVHLEPGAITVQNGTISITPGVGQTVQLDNVLGDPEFASNDSAAAVSIGFEGTVFGSGGTVDLSGTAHTGNLDVHGDPFAYSFANLLLQGGTIVANTVTVDAVAALSGNGVVEGAIELIGTITATGGTLELTGPVTADGYAIGITYPVGFTGPAIPRGGFGSLHIGNAGTLRLDATDTANITFDAGGSNEVLALSSVSGLTYGIPILNGVTTVGTSVAFSVIDGFTVGDIVHSAGLVGASAAFTQTGTTTSIDFSYGGTDLGTLVFGSLYPTGALTFDPITGDITTSAQPNGQTVACFAAGTRIVTPSGAVAVERLREGDLVMTESGLHQPIKWIGRRTLDCRRHPKPETVRPIRIAPHAFGEGRPMRPLLLSPDHAVFVDDVLVPIKLLINGTTIRQAAAKTVTYYHIELPQHDVVLAEGLTVESYLECGNRESYENGGGVMRLYPDFSPDALSVAQRWDALGYAPLLVERGALVGIKRGLAVQAAILENRPPRQKVGHRAAPAAA